MEESRDPNYQTVASVTSDALHNKNCYLYLSQIKLPSIVIEEMATFPLIRKLQESKTYDPEVSYGAIYTHLMEELEEILLAGFRLEEKDWDDFFLSVYENDNHILEETYDVAVKNIVASKTPSTAPVKGEIKNAVRDREDAKVNLHTPAGADTGLSRFASVFGPEYKPSYTTSLATERRYGYNKTAASQELRFGTQGQVENYYARVNPIFERFLEVQARQANKKQPITHIYFNNLGMHRKKLALDAYEGWFESALTRELHHLEETHPNIMVITLPADKGLMSHHDVFHTAAEINREDLKQLFLDIAMESPNATLAIKDFHISSAARAMIFGTKEQEQDTLTLLLEQSFITLGLDKTVQLSPAQRQAVWVHFIKYELPKYILESIKPKTYNFSCKDAIDRGGISSAYYNLLSSFATDTPMSRDEFEQGLHAAPTLVKGRGMNDHLDIIWNAVDQYLTANPKVTLIENKQWLIAWRDANCPTKRAGELLGRRLEECITNLENLEEEASKPALEILKSIQAADKSDPKHQALYLDAVVSTHELAVYPKRFYDKAKQDDYPQLIARMAEASAPTTGLMQGFWDWLQSFFTSAEHIASKKQRREELKTVVGQMNKQNIWKTPLEGQRFDSNQADRHLPDSRMDKNR